MTEPVMKRRDQAAVLFIIAVAIVSYFNALSNGFVYDDLYLVLHNTRLGGWNDVPVIFRTGYWEDGGGLYRPLTILSFLLEHSIAGYNPIIYHLDNLLLHLGCSLLIYAILKPLLDRRPAALFASVLFAAHPVHAEAVAWVSGRAELLSAILALISFRLYTRNPPSRTYAVLSCCAFFLALLSKEAAVVLPLLIAAHMVLFSAEQGISAKLKRVAGLYPYAAVFLVYMLIRVSVIGKAVPTGEEVTLGNFTPYQVFLVMCESLFQYMRLGFFPISLSEDYLFYPAGSILHFRVAVPLLITALLFIFAARLAKKSRPALFGVLWFYIALLPVSNIIPIGLIMSERAMYLPSAGVCILLGLWFSRAYEAASAKPSRPMAYAVVAMFALTTVLLAAGTINRNPVWKDQEEFSKRVIKMWQRRISLAPGYAPYYSALAKEYINRDEYGPEAEDAARTAIRLDEGDSTAHYCLAMVYMDKGRLTDALGEARTSIRLHETAEAYNLAGGILYALGSYDESDSMSEKAAELAPRSALYLVNRGYTRLKLDDPDTALALFEKALGLDPDNVDALTGLGEILNGREQYTAAAGKLERAIALNPDKEDAHYSLAVAYMNTGRNELAVRELEKTLAINPDNKEAEDILHRMQKQSD